MVLGLGHDELRSFGYRLEKRPLKLSVLCLVLEFAIPCSSRNLFFGTTGSFIHPGFMQESQGPGQ